MKKIILSISAIICAAMHTHAQNQDDVLMFSRTSPLGTARSQGAGGAFGAVGADFSSTLINPAGLGMYRRNEANMSMAINADLSSAKYLGTTSEDSRTSFHIPSLGVVVSKVYNEMGNDREKGLVSLNFATGFNRTANYQQNYYYSGINTQSSVLDHYTDSNGARIPYAQLEEGVSYNDNLPLAQAWRAFLINTNPGSIDTYRSWVTNNSNYALKQTNQAQARGAAYEYNISAAANVSNFLYLGAGLIFTNINYEYTSVFEETVLDNSVAEYKGMKLTNNTTASGTGVSGRFGIIVRPLDFLKIGFSTQTPARLNMRNDYKYTTTAYFTTQPSLSVDPQRSSYIEYQIITPAHYTGSAALTFTKFGFVSVDVEMIDYPSAQLKSDEFNFESVNTSIKNTFQQAINIRLGAEYKIDDATGSLADSYRIRAGYGIYGSPYKASAVSASESDLTRQSVSAGLGLIFGQLFFDFTTVGLFGKDYYKPYTVSSGSPVAENSFTNYNFVLSGGMRF